MYLFPDVLWINVSPALSGFDQPLIKAISQHSIVGKWQYSQSADEPTDLETALVLLHDYLKQCDRPIHLIGHSTSGLLGLLYARRYPNRVRSLTLLSVGVHPAIDWQAHYYTQLQFLCCPRTMVLAQTACNLIGYQATPVLQFYVQMLEQDLVSSLSPHSLYSHAHRSPGGAEVPMLICGGEHDVVVDPSMIRGWFSHLKQGDRFWSCPEGRYFFHYEYAKQTYQVLKNFWRSQSCHPSSFPHSATSFHSQTETIHTVHENN